MWKGFKGFFLWLRDHHYHYSLFLYLLVGTWNINRKRKFVKIHIRSQFTYSYVRFIWNLVLCRRKKWEKKWMKTWSTDNRIPTNFSHFFLFLCLCISDSYVPIIIQIIRIDHVLFTKTIEFVFLFFFNHNFSLLSFYVYKTGTERIRKVSIQFCCQTVFLDRLSNDTSDVCLMFLFVLLFLVLGLFLFLFINVKRIIEI